MYIPAIELVSAGARQKKSSFFKLLQERETGVGPATSTLARWRSTTELFPHKSVVVKKCGGRDLNSHAEAPDPKSGVSANSTTPAGVKSFKSCDYGKI